MFKIQSSGAKKRQEVQEHSRPKGCKTEEKALLKKSEKKEFWKELEVARDLLSDYPSSCFELTVRTIEPQPMFKKFPQNTKEVERSDCDQKCTRVLFSPSSLVLIFLPRLGLFQGSAPVTRSCDLDFGKKPRMTPSTRPFAFVMLKLDFVDCRLNNVELGKGGKQALQLVAAVTAITEALRRKCLLFSCSYQLYSHDVRK